MYTETATGCQSLYLYRRVIAGQKKKRKITEKKHDGYMTGRQANIYDDKSVMVRKL